MAAVSVYRIANGDTTILYGHESAAQAMLAGTWQTRAAKCAKVMRERLHQQQLHRCTPRPAITTH
jgi:hypothetical protein